MSGLPLVASGSSFRETTDSRLVAVVGDAALDLSFAVPALDGIDEKVAATDCRRELGGTGANAAAAVVRLGGRARLHAVIGSDPIGLFILEQLAARGIDTAGVSVVEGRSTAAVILRSPGRRLVVVDRGVADDGPRLDPAIVAADAALIYLSATPWVTIASLITGSAVPVVVGIEARQGSELAAVGTPEEVAQVLDHALVVLTNEAGADALAEPLHQLAAAALVVTRGAAGATIVVPGRPPVEVSAPTVDVVDATGAGDCFAGALCRFLAGGTSLERAVRLATIAASLSTRQVGAQAGIPGEREVLARF